MFHLPIFPMRRTIFEAAPSHVTFGQPGYLGAGDWFGIQVGNEKGRTIQSQVADCRDCYPPPPKFNSSSPLKSYRFTQFSSRIVSQASFFAVKLRGCYRDLILPGGRSKLVVNF